MARQSSSRGGDARYFIRFGVTALLLVAATLVLVLVVLPQRYVLSAGFRESGINFPDPGTPFTPPDPVRVAALPIRTPANLDSIVRGPAEIFWSRVLPLLESARYSEALPVFDEYLLEHPGDVDVRRELALTLISAGRSGESIPVLSDLVRDGGDPATRRLLARTLRDDRRIAGASAQYEILSDAAPRDETLALEWARALASAERYSESEGVLRRALSTAPTSVPLRAELARIYYYTGGLEEARALLESMSEQELAAADALQLRADVRSALAVPEVEDTPPPPPTLLEQAMAAREEDDFEIARALYERALAESPNDPEGWLAYANLLEYELGDAEGALRALDGVDRLGAADADLRFRMALLEERSGRRPDALARLGLLVAELEARPTPVATAEGHTPPLATAEVRALTGDLLRYDGERVRAAEQYELALADDPENRRALDGREAVRAEVTRAIQDVESPRIGSLVFGLGDTDDFGRLDLGGEWVGVREGWAWSGSIGQRWLTGLDPAAAPSDLGGAFVEVSPARWWRQGTIRTALRFGAQRVRADATDVTFGAGLQYRPPRGGRFMLEYTHEPAYGLTATLQSAATQVVQDRIVASMDRGLSELWSLTIQADLAILETVGVPGTEASDRLQAAASVSRAVTSALSVGWSATALTYTEAAPAPGGLRLFWDPAGAVSTGPVAVARGSLADRWEASARVNPGFALIDERTPSGLETVPQLSADAHLEYVGERYRAAIDVFYAQARLEGYRTYGARISLSAAGLLSGGSGR